MATATRVEHGFDRRYEVNRRDVYLLRTETGWQVLVRRSGADAPRLSTTSNAKTTLA